MNNLLKAAAIGLLIAAVGRLLTMTDLPAVINPRTDAAADPPEREGPELKATRGPPQSSPDTIIVAEGDTPNEYRSSGAWIEGVPFKDLKAKDDDQ